MAAIAAAYRERKKMSDHDLLTQTEAAKFVRLSERTLQRLIEDGRGPARLKLSERRVGFLKSDLLQWLQSLRANVRA
jgi:excisionase family DNA binding protein